MVSRVINKGVFGDVLNVLFSDRIISIRKQNTVFHLLLHSLIAHK